MYPGCICLPVYKTLGSLYSLLSIVYKALGSLYSRYSCYSGYKALGSLYSLLFRVIRLSGASQPPLIHPFHCWWMLPASLIHPFHCWSEERAPCRLVPVPRPAPLPVSLLASSPAPVVLYFIINFMLQPWALGRGMDTPLTTRFTVGGQFVRQRIINFVSNIEPWAGGRAQDCQHPFHCWTSRMCESDDTFLSENPGFDKKAQKTLG